MPKHAKTKTLFDAIWWLEVKIRASGNIIMILSML